MGQGRAAGASGSAGTPRIERGYSPLKMSKGIDF